MRLTLFSAVAPLVVAGAVFAQTPAVPAGLSHYTIVQANDGKTVGTADCTVSSIPGGYQFTSHGELKMPKFTYSFSNENRMDSQLNIVRDQLSGTVKGSEVTFFLSSDSTGRQFQVSIVAQGKTTTNTFDRHQHLALLPDLDPAGYVAMAHFALEHPPTAWVVIPKQNGLLVPALYTPDADAQGTLNGRAVTVHHVSVTVSDENGFTVEIYSTSDGTVMETDLPEQNFYVIRDGFKLQSRPQYKPPRGQAPPPPSSGQGQPGQGGQVRPQATQPSY